MFIHGTYWTTGTYMAMTIGDVVRQFQLVERDARFRHPSLASCRRVGVNVHSLGQLGIGLASDHPLGVVVLVTARHAVEQRSIIL